MTDVTEAVSEAFREQWGQIVATLIRITGDWDLAEECAQDAFAKAVLRWRTDGVPSRPGAWLTTTARNRAIDRLRREARGKDKLLEAADLWYVNEPVSAYEEQESDAISDDRLRLIYTCCHPALSPDTSVALALRMIAGLSTSAIARAFLVSEMTMSKRLLRAKSKIRNSVIPFRVPPAHLLAERTDAVLGVLYLMFNEGYTASSGAELVRDDLCLEAIRLVRTVVELMPNEAEARGLLALMLLHDARRMSRIDDRGDLVTLECQDRSRWDAAMLSEGIAVLEDAQEMRRPGPYQLQAAILACHVSAPSAAATNWPRIVSLYGELLKMFRSPVVQLNRAIAVAMSIGPDAGLALLDELECAGELDDYHLLPAARADLLRRLHRFVEAEECYRAAIECGPSDIERRYLSRRLLEVSQVGQRASRPA